MNKSTKGQLRGWVLAALLGGCAALPSLAPAQTALSSITRVSSFEYDADGLLIREVIEPDQAQDCLQTNHSYNAQGNPTSKSSSACAGASGHTFASAGSAQGTTKEYLAQTVVIEGVSYSTPAGVFATRTTNALNHSESYEYDPRHGRERRQLQPCAGVVHARSELSEQRHGACGSSPDPSQWLKFAVLVANLSDVGCDGFDL